MDETGPVSAVWNVWIFLLHQTSQTLAISRGGMLVSFNHVQVLYPHLYGVLIAVIKDYRLFFLGGRVILKTTAESSLVKQRTMSEQPRSIQKIYSEEDHNGL